MYVSWYNTTWYPWWFYNSIAVLTLLTKMHCSYPPMFWYLGCKPTYIHTYVYMYLLHIACNTHEKWAKVNDTLEEHLRIKSIYHTILNTVIFNGYYIHITPPPTGNLAHVLMVNKSCMFLFWYQVLFELYCKCTKLMHIHYLMKSVMYLRK